MTEQFKPIQVLPARPSLESIRKQAKKLAREVAAGNVEAIGRARAQLSDLKSPPSQRDAQLIVAREYGFSSWQALREEVARRVDKGLDWAAVQAEHAIHNNDIEQLKRLLTEYPALLSFQNERGGTLLTFSTGAYRDSFDPEVEETHTRAAIAAFLIDAGAAMIPAVWEGALRSRARGILRLLWNKGVLPRRLKILAALGDLDGVRAYFSEPDQALAGATNSDSSSTVNEAFICACRFKHKEVASFLLDRCVALDDQLQQRVEGWRGRDALIDYLGEHPEEFGAPWRTLVVNELKRAIGEDDRLGFTGWLRNEPWLLDEACVDLQVELIEHATINDRESFIEQLLDLDPAVVRLLTPPPSAAIRFALEYGKTHLVPQLTRVWPLPNDLPHAAGLGDFDRVKRWFDPSGNPALGNPDDHYHHDAQQSQARRDATTEQLVLDAALAWACINRHLDIAAFLLDHGANINTDWCTHEPASILHELVFHDNYETMQFLIDRGIDMTMLDHRWNATAAGWAYNAANDQKKTDFLMTAEERRRERGG